MHEAKSRNQTSAVDIAAFTEDTSKSGPKNAPLTDSERNHALMPKPLVKIVDYGAGTTTQATLAELNQQMRNFSKVILLIEDEKASSDACASALHDLGYGGVQLITRLLEAEQHLDDIISNLTQAPAAIVLDLGLGLDSGFTILRKCHAEPKLQQVPILVWTKHTDELAATFSNYLGAHDFLVKSNDKNELRDALHRLLVSSEAETVA